MHSKQLKHARCSLLVTDTFTCKTMNVVRRNTMRGRECERERVKEIQFGLIAA